MKRGRTFSTHDHAGAPPVAIVNEAFVRAYYPSNDPVGRRVRWVSGNGEWITIVGVVADVRGLSLDRDEVPAVHIPYRQERSSWRAWMDVVVRSEADPATVAAAMRRQLTMLDRTVPLMKVGTMEQVIAGSVADRRFSLLSLGAFAVLALILAAAGTYGVMSYTVEQRTREMGIRLALGARPSDLFRIIVGRGLAFASVGVAIGLAAAFSLGQLLTGMLFSVTPSDPMTFAGAAVVLLAAAVLASVIPARRASRADPLCVLRSE
jgi:predicted permease